MKGTVNSFSDEPAFYRPVWEFILSRGNKSYRFPILVNCLTGNVASNHDGIVESSVGNIMKLTMPLFCGLILV